MKIVNLTEFLKMPAGVLFSKYQPHVFGELCIKGENCGKSDFDYQALTEVKASNTDEWCHILDNAVDAAEKTGVSASVELDFEISQRDGCYEEKQLFAIWDYNDTIRLATLILKSAVEAIKTIAMEK